MKKIRIVSICLLIILFISNIIFLIQMSGENLIKYEDSQNTDTIVEILQAMKIEISNDVHIQEIIYESSFHNFKLSIKYKENGEEKAIKDAYITGNDNYRNYFIHNGISITKAIREPIQRVYLLLYVFIVIIIMVTIYGVKKKRN